MKSFRLIAILILAGTLLITLIALMEQSARAQEQEPPFPADVYLKLRPDISAQQVNGSTSAQENPQSLISSNIMTNILGPGDNLIHGFIYYDGYLWASTRTQPARILKINPSTLEVETRIILQDDYDEGEDILAAQGYIWVILFTDSTKQLPDPARLIRVDPDTATAEVAIVFKKQDFLFGASLEHAFGYLWAGGRERIARIDISDPLVPTYQIYDYGSLVVDETGLFSALTSSQTDLWGSMYQYITPTGFLSSTVVRIDPDIPTNILAETVSVLFPDDIIYTGNYLYISSEDSGNPSDIYQFASDPSNYTVTHAANNASYGTFLNPLDPKTFWGTYVGSPGIVKKFDLSPSGMVTITLPVNFDDPNELAFDENGNMYVTTWMKPSGIVKYPAPSRVLDLSINQSGSDAVLNWGHIGGDVIYYQVWRSTERSFTPGDDLSEKIGEVIPLGNTVTFTDNNAAAELAPNYYYVVKSVNSYGLVSPASNEVSLASTTTTISSHLPNPSMVGQLVTVSYSVTSSRGTPTGSVTVSDGTIDCTGTVAAGTCSLTFTSAGLKTLVATYEGDDNFDSSVSAGVSHKVIADTATTITSHSPNPSNIGQTVTVSYEVVSNGGTPTGNVTVSDGTDSCTGTVAEGGCLITFRSLGMKTLVAVYEGDNYYNSSTSAGVIHLVTTDVPSKDNTTTAIASHTPNPSDVGEEVVIAYTVTSASGTPTGNVTVSDGTDSCTGAVADGRCSITFLTPGTKTLVAVYEGDKNFNSSISAEVTHVVVADNPSKTNTTTTIAAHTPNPSQVGQAVSVSYTVTSVSGIPTGNVIVSDGVDSCKGTVSSGMCSINFSSVGIKTLIAIYGGDSNFNSSISAEVTHIVTERSLYLPVIAFSTPNK